MIRYPAGFGGDVRIKRYLDYYQSGYGSTMLTPLSSAPPGPFTPASLFTGGEAGVWYAPSNITSYLAAFDASLGSELVTNGNFDTDTDWTKGTGWSISGGSAVKTAGSGSSISQTIASSSSTYYKAVITITVTAGSFSIRFGANADVTPAATFTASGTYTRYFYASGGDNLFRIFGGSTAAGSVDSISVKVVSDISNATMYQNTAMTLPVTTVGQSVAVIKDQSRVSAGTLLGSELVVNGTFASDTDWTKGTGWSISAGVASITSQPSVSELTQSIVLTAGKSYYISFDITAYTSGSFIMQFTGGTGSGSQSFSSTGTHSTIIPAFSGNNILSLRAAASTVGSIDNVSVKEIGTTHAFQPNSSYQPTLQQDGNGNYYLSFDGTNDWLGTGTLDFSATDEVAAVFGIRRLASVKTSVFAEFSRVTGSSNGSFFTSLVETATPAYTAGLAVRGTSYVTSTGTATAFPATYVFTAFSKISTDNRTIRLNETETVLAATDLGTGNFGQWPLFIGSRGSNYAVALPGYIYSVIVRNKLFTPTELSDTETWVNGVTDAY